MNNEYLDMKKSIVTLLLVCLTMGSWAVERPKQGFGFQISWAQPILRINRPGTSALNDSLKMAIKMNGFKVGVVYDASYIAGFGSTIGINYTFGVYTGKWRALGIYSDFPRIRQHITYHQLELFVDWQYKFEIAKETYLMLYTGPTLQCGIDFDMRVDSQKDYDVDVEHSYYDGYKSDDPDESFRRLNVTWGVGAGFQYKRYFLRGGYDFGLMNPYKHSDFANEKHTRGRLDQWNIRLGVYLWYHE